MANTTDNNLMDWGDVIADDGAVFEIMPEGDYDFTVRGFARGVFNGGKTIPQCNKAVLTLDVTDGTHKGVVTTDLILHKILEWKISAFFRAVGMKKHGEPLRMDWDHVAGRKGRCHIAIREWEGRNGDKMQSNDVDKWYDASDTGDFKPVADPDVPWSV